jgi:hypothetical protein
MGIKMKNHEFQRFESYYFMEILLFSWVLEGTYRSAPVFLDWFLVDYSLFLWIFSVLFHGNSALFMNFRGVRKVRARTVLAPPNIHYCHCLLFGKIFYPMYPSCHTDSNDISFMSVWCPGAESIEGHTHRIRILLYRFHESEAPKFSL